MQGRPLLHSRWLTLALSLHFVLATLIGLVGVIYPRALLIYANEEQARACGDCLIALDLARAFGCLNITIAILLARFLWVTRLGARYGRSRARAHARVLLAPLSVSMVINLALRLSLIASGRFSAVEWVSVAASAFLAVAYCLCAPPY